MPWHFKKTFTGAPKRILLSNWGSLGDIVLSTGLVKVIREKFPHCQIGFLTTKYSQAILDTCPGIDWVHVVDPWDNPALSKWQRMCRLLWFTIWKQPVIAKKLASLHYDVAIELRPYFPNSIPLLWKARIPWRIGFATGGNSLLLNAKVPWPGDQYLPNCYWSLLHFIGIQNTKTPMPFNIHVQPTTLPHLPGSFLIFHPCSLAKEKEFPIDVWQNLYNRCQHAGYNIYVTGKGEREKIITEQIAGNSSTNLCNLLDWKQLISLIQKSKFLVSVDSVPVHVAAAFSIPSAILYRATPSHKIWYPDQPNTTAFGIDRPVNPADVFATIHQSMGAS
jgi:ADP-heptose:LPS heptosyltransferase